MARASLSRPYSTFSATTASRPAWTPSWPAAPTAIPTELAQLIGQRFICAAETYKDHKWNEERLEELTGGDTVSARYMRPDFFTFHPTHKLLFHGNYRPCRTDVSPSMSRRMRMVSFRFTPPRPDPNLGNKLCNEAAGVLRWMLYGCLEWQKASLPESGAVSDATRKYFVESDVVGQWMEECCETARNAETPVSELWARYDQWCAANGERSGTMRAK